MPSKTKIVHLSRTGEELLDRARELYKLTPGAPEVPRSATVASGLALLCDVLDPNNDTQLWSAERLSEILTAKAFELTAECVNRVLRNCDEVCDDYDVAACPEEQTIIVRVGDKRIVLNPKGEGEAPAPGTLQ